MQPCHQSEMFLSNSVGVMKNLHRGLAYLPWSKRNVSLEIIWTNCAKSRKSQQLFSTAKRPLPPLLEVSDLIENLWQMFVFIKHYNIWQIVINLWCGGKTGKSSTKKMTYFCRIEDRLQFIVSFNLLTLSKFLIQWYQSKMNCQSFNCLFTLFACWNSLSSTIMPVLQS